MVAIMLVDHVTGISEVHRKIDTSCFHYPLSSVSPCLPGRDPAYF
jgi:hypothetical protein